MFFTPYYTTARLDMLLGAQVSISTKDSFFSDIKRAYEKGANVIQVHLRKMHSASKYNRVLLPDALIRKVNAFTSSKKIQLFVHGSYLLNFCRTPVGLIRIQWMYDILREDLLLSEKLKVKGLVIHMCTQRAVDAKRKPVMLTLEETVRRNVEHISYFLKNNRAFKTKLLLEISASDGKKIGGTLPVFGDVFRPIYKQFSSRVGVCLDTCHAFASGYAMNTVAGVKNFFEQYKKCVGSLRTVKLIHLNDSMDPLGSKRDRHAALGRGYIYSSDEGRRALGYLVRQISMKHNIPLCLETGTRTLRRQFLFVRELSKAQTAGRSLATRQISDIIKLLKEFEETHAALGNATRAQQYKKAISSLQKSKMKVVSNVKILEELPHIGKGITSKLEEWARTGKISLLEEFRRNPIVKAKKELTTVYAIGPKKATELIDKHGIYSIRQLKEAVKKRPGLLTVSQKKGLLYFRNLQKKIPRAESVSIERSLKRVLKDKEVFLAGSYKMGKSVSGDVDVIVVVDKAHLGALREIIGALYESGLLVDYAGRKCPGERSLFFSGFLQLPSKPVRRVDVHLVERKNLPYHMLYFSSGETFSKYIRSVAKKQGYVLNQKGLFKNGKKVPVKTERDIFKKLNLEWTPYQNR